MILYIVLGVITLLLFCGFYFLYYSPKKKIDYIYQQAISLGYKVKKFPFKFMNYYLFTYIQQDQKSLKIFKQELVNYDLLVGNMLNRAAILTINTQMLKDFANQQSKLPKNPFFVDVFLLMNGGGIVFSEGQNWKRKRRIISNVFHFDFLNSIIPVIEEQIQLQFKKVDQKIKNQQNVNLLNTFVKIYSTVVEKCFFGTDLSGNTIQGKPFCQYFVQFLNEIGEYVKSAQHILFGMKLYKLQLTSLSKRLKKRYQIILEIVKQVTLQQLQKIKKKQTRKRDILTALYQNGMLNLDGKPNSDQYSLDELIGQFFAFFAAGTDTTSNAVNLTMHYLSQHKQCLDKLRQQINQVSKLQNQTSAERLKSMKWAQAIFNQTLRINGPSPSIISRMAIEDLSIGQIKVPKGTCVSSFHIINHNKKQNFESPSQFKPQRWMNNSKIQPYTFTPFSVGQRNCIGQYLARLQAKITMQKLVMRYNFKALNPIKMRLDFVYVTSSGQFQMEFRNK